MALSQPAAGASLFGAVSFGVLISLTSQLSRRVSELVPEPYLDEIFHIPQAQVLCRGRYDVWDDKITTPPGLYLASFFFKRLYGAPGNDCSVESLRGTNLLAFACIPLIAALCRMCIEARASAGPLARSRASLSIYAIHSALNIALFPVIFLFSSLYYTDVMSTLFVLLAYLNHLLRQPPYVSLLIVRLVQDLLVVVLGVAALFMRQTNVFWVVVYMGGLEAVGALKTLNQGSTTAPAFSTLAQEAQFYAGRYVKGDIHDPPLNLAWPDDFVLVVISSGLAALGNLPLVIRRVWPYLVLALVFAQFVIWNGGVVLGDKSNHVATLHLAQMLYIWPFFAFFSAPLFIPSVLRWARLILDIIYGRSSLTPSSLGGTISKPSNPRPIAPPQTWLLSTVDFIFTRKAYALPLAVLTLGASLAIVRYNTIVHPFLLADNRHYMFYVFRYAIRPSPVLRLALVGPYALAAWMCWAALRGCAPTTGGGNPLCPASPQFQSRGSRPYICSPFAAPDPARVLPSSGSIAPPAAGATTATAADAGDEARASALPAPASTALLWLVASAASLVTAPLVEPRYFILPWVFWRLLVPAWPSHECATSSAAETAGGTKNGGTSGKANAQTRPGTGRTLWARLFGGVGAVFYSYFDARLVLETIWFLAIDAATAYIFLYRPYQWRAQDGSLLDEGRLQRFLW